MKLQAEAPGQGKLHLLPLFSAFPSQWRVCSRVSNSKKEQRAEESVGLSVTVVLSAATYRLKIYVCKFAESQSMEGFQVLVL